MASTTGTAPAPAPKASSSRMPFIPRSSMTGLFSKPKPSSADVANQRPKESRSGFFQNLKSSRITLQRGKEKANATGENDRPDHPASVLPMETFQAFGQPSTASDGQFVGNRRSISNLVDLEQQRQAGWRPLFERNLDSHVPDAQDRRSSGAEKTVDLKGKGKAPNYLSNEQMPTENLLGASQSAGQPPLGLPQAYQIMAGKDARKSPHYNYSSLYGGRAVLELWDPDGDTLIYLCAKNSATPRGPSFLVNSLTLQATSDYWVTAFSPVWQSGFEIDKTNFPTAKYALFFAADRPDGKREETDPVTLLRHYITMRNVFACIFDSYCVGLMEDESSLLSDLVDRMLMYFDGAEDSLGDKLSGFIIKSGLWDVSNDPIKAVDLLHLAYTYQMEALYIEAFVHCVGMWPQIVSTNAHDILAEPILKLLTSRHESLTKKTNILSSNLKNFHFSELWTVKSPASKLSSTLRQGYESMRSFLYKYYTSTGFPKWPPKNLISRPVLLKIYSDFCALYRLLIDRQYTTSNACNSYPSLFYYAGALRHIDRKIVRHNKSMPYGIPILPGYFVQPLRQDIGDSHHPEVFRYDMHQKLNSDGLADLLGKMYNDAGTRNMVTDRGEEESITTAFMGFEKALLKGKNMKSIAETRKGVWVLVYGVLSAMAELSVEGGVVFNEEVEYLLCCDPRNVFEWEGKRARPTTGEEDPNDPNMDRWSVASLKGTEGNPGTDGAETTATGTAAGDSDSGSEHEAGRRRRAVTFRDMRPSRAELSYPWIISQSPGWCLGSPSEGV
ncbi:hypothetical protein ABW20_dc0107824 [Dactylellina cionopaga]|nr:hypothetical protein ABW20_dc0107824 [Dactylellina cionopaga]